MTTSTDPTGNAPKGNKTVTRSIRIEEEIWNRVKARAEQDGVTSSTVAKRLLHGYADGKLPLPRVTMVYK